MEFLFAFDDSNIGGFSDDFPSVIVIYLFFAGIDGFLDL